MSTALTQQRAAEIAEERLGYPSFGVFNGVREKDLHAAMEQYHREASAHAASGEPLKHPGGPITQTELDALSARARRDHGGVVVLESALQITEQPASAEPVAMSRHSFAMLCNVLWHHQGGSSPVGQPIRGIIGIGQHDRMTDEQLDEAKWIDRLLATADQAAPQPDSGRVEEMEAEIDKLGDDVVQLRASRDSLLVERNSLARRVAELEAECERLRKDAASSALRHAAQVVELFDDATMQNNYMIDSKDCAAILQAMAEYHAAIAARKEG